MKYLKMVVAAFAALLLNMHPALATGAFGGDIGTIEGRMIATYSKGQPSDKEIASLIATVDAKGGFSDIDYKDDTYNTGGVKSKHFVKLLKLVKGYNNPQSSYHQSVELRKIIEAQLAFWIATDPEDDNWWHRNIGFPKSMMPCALLMKSSLQQHNPELLAEIIDYLDYSWEETPPRFMTGANGTDVCQVALTNGILSDNEEMVKSVMEFVGSLVFISQGGNIDGIYPDFSFSQHCGSGRQLYLGTYGREYIVGLLHFMELTHGTSYAIATEKVDMLENLVTYGVAWMWYKGELDPNQCGRRIFDETDFAASFIPVTQRFIALDLPQKQAHEQVLDMMNGKRELIGNRAYPYHDYMIHRGKGYMTTVRMTSTRTVGNEAGNGQGFGNYHTGDGATYFKVHGDEYSPIFPTYNWHQIPGTTVVVDDKPMPRPMWGAGGTGAADYAGVASTGTSGAAGFIFAKDEMVAHKAWFNFPELTVALGAAITSERTDAPVITTVNQTTLRGDVAVDDNKIWHNDIGYINLGDNTIDIKEDTAASTLTLSIDHGVAPNGDSYAYAVYPNVSQGTFEKERCQVDILSNSQDIQAVRHHKSGEIQAIFYKGGVLQIDRKTTLSLSQEAVVVCTPSKGGYTISVGNPYCENAPIDKLQVVIKRGSKVIPTAIK